MIKTQRELFQLLESVEGLCGKVAYYAFPVNEAPPLPFICYFSPSENNFSADGVAFYTAKAYNVELYTNTREPETEEKLENALKGAGIFYTKNNIYLPDEKLWQIVYEMEV